jgi:hypothetical protein
VHTWSIAHLVNCTPGQLHTWSSAHLVKCTPGQVHTWSIAHLVMQLTAQSAFGARAAALPRYPY